MARMKKKASSLHIKGSAALIALFFAGILVSGAFGDVSPITITTSTFSSTTSSDSTQTTTDAAATDIAPSTSVATTTEPSTTTATTTTVAVVPPPPPSTATANFAPTIASDQADYKPAST